MIDNLFLSKNESFDITQPWSHIDQEHLNINSEFEIFCDGGYLCTAKRKFYYLVAIVIDKLEERKIGEFFIPLKSCEVNEPLQYLNFKTLSIEMGIDIAQTNKLAKVTVFNNSEDDVANFWLKNPETCVRTQNTRKLTVHYTTKKTDLIDMLDYINQIWEKIYKEEVFDFFYYKNMFEYKNANQHPQIFLNFLQKKGGNCHHMAIIKKARKVVAMYSTKTYEPDVDWEIKLIKNIIERKIFDSPITFVVNNKIYKNLKKIYEGLSENEEIFSFLNSLATNGDYPIFFEVDNERQNQIQSHLKKIYERNVNDV